MKNEYDIKKELKRLSSIKGSGTELISIYVPPDFQISDEIAKLKEEHGQASNIKSKTTKQNVQGAIEKIIQYLKLYKTPPKNGLIVFCGNISSIFINYSYSNHTDVIGSNLYVSGDAGFLTQCGISAQISS